MANETAKPLASTGIADIVGLIVRIILAFLRNPVRPNLGLVLGLWITEMARRSKSGGIILNFGIRRFLLVTAGDLSQHILNQNPSNQSYTGGPSKVRAMSFLASKALTIRHDEDWQRLRPLNENTLSIGDAPALQQSILDQVREAFTHPISSANDIRKRMADVMLGVVFGGGPERLAQDVEALFGYVQSPLRRRFLGWTQNGRRNRFYATIRQMSENRQSVQDSSLLTRGCLLARSGGIEEEELLQQIPHWMFTFTGSGTNLLSRTLAMIGSRPEVGERVRQEIAAAGPLDQANSISQLNYLEACLLETCRLFPPVTRTFHVAPQGDIFGGISIPAGMEILHYFPISQRDTSVDPWANDFEPDKWLGTSCNRRSVYPNLFLSGPRACPGESLILFVCKAAIAILHERHNGMASSRALTKDPLPFSFPNETPRFQTS